MRTLMWMLALAAPVVLQAQIAVERSYHPSGSLQEVRVVEGMEVNFIRYHANGRVYERGGFVDGKRSGVWKRFDQEGKLVAKVRFKDGLRDGKAIYAGYADGLRYRVQYSDGRVVSGRQFDESGQVLAERDMR